MGKLITIKELEEFYYSTGEDIQMWDTEEKGPYPIERVVNALKEFINYHSTN